MSIKVLQIVVSKNVSGIKSSVTGPERRAANLAKNWKKHGIEVVICYPTSGSLHHYFNDANLKVIDFEIKGKFDFFAIRTLKKIIQDNNIDLVHSQGAAALDLIVSLSAKQARVSSVVTRPVMICDQIHYSKIKRKIYEILDQNITLKLVDKLITVSHLGATILKNRYNVHEQKIKVIHNGVDLEKFEDKSNIKFHKTKSEEIIIGMVGHLTSFKGWYDFIKTIKLINERTTFKIKAFIIGDGIMRDELEDKVANLGLRDLFVFTGYQDKIKDILNQLDIFLFTTHREGLSVAVIEVLASGLPIVATNIGGINEQIDEEENGYVLPKGDIDGMADKCLELINNHELRIKFGKKSREIAEERFSQKRMFLEHIECYKNVLKINF